MTYWERLLAEYVGGGDSPISPTLIAKSITTNGTYNAVDDEADGYSSVSVNVSNTSTLKGAPPLIFKTSEEQLRDWIIYGNDYEHKYSTSGTLPRTFTTHTAGAADTWTIYGNDENGTENFFDKANCGLIQVDVQGTLRFGSIMYGVENGEYTLACDNQSGRALYLQTLTNDTYTNVNVTSLLPYTFTVHDIDALILRSTTTQKTDWETIGVYDIMLVKGSTTPDHYIPYQKGVGEQRQDGYYVPLTISQTGQTDKNYDIYIGDSPLTEGETVSKASTGVDIVAMAGSNTITTDLYNKPSMSIEGVDYVGVGRRISDDRYEILLECNADVTPYDPNAEESNTSYVYNSNTYAFDTNFQYKTALIDLPGTGGRYTITKTLGSTFKIEELTGPVPWGGVDHYFRIGNPITPSGTSYTSLGNDVDCLLVTYYDDTVDTLTPQEIRENITVSAQVYNLSSIEFSAPLTEGEILTPAMIPGSHKYIGTIPGAVNVLENFDHLHPGSGFGEYEMGITYANMNSTLINKTVNQNGTYVSAYDNVNGYTSVAVNVPNTYTSEDESKVVSDGALVAQTTTSVTANGIVDTTTIRSVSVNVPDIVYYKNDVTFYDYDGTIIVSYSAAEFAELTEMPANPTHTGLISKGWNWTLADAKTFVAAHGFLPIGQCYDPVDDKLRIDIELVPETLSPYLCLGVNGTAVVDWGDGTATDTITGSSATTAYYTPQHTYTAAGKYTITVDITGEACIISSSGSNGACRILTATNANPSYEQQNAVYKSAVVGIHLCSKVTLQTYAFKNLYSLRYITFDTTRTSVNRWFDGCMGLTTLIFPPSATSIGTVATGLSGLCVVSLAKTNSFAGANPFNDCYSLKELAIPEDTADTAGICLDCYSMTRSNIPSTWTKVNGAIFCNARSLRSVVIPSGVTEIGSQAFSGCWSLAELDIPDSVTTFDTYAFEKCYSLKFIKFHSATPPTAGSYAFSALPTTCTIYVPTGSLADYTSASNYPSSSSYTYVEY